MILIWEKQEKYIPFPIRFPFLNQLSVSLQLCSWPLYWETDRRSTKGDFGVRESFDLEQGPLQKPLITIFPDERKWQKKRPTKRWPPSTWSWSSASSQHSSVWFTVESPLHDTTVVLVVVLKWRYLSKFGFTGKINLYFIASLSAFPLPRPTGKQLSAWEKLQLNSWGELLIPFFLLAFHLTLMPPEQVIDVSKLEDLGSMKDIEFGLSPKLSSKVCSEDDLLQPLLALHVSRGLVPP